MIIPGVYRVHGCAIAHPHRHLERLIMGMILLIIIVLVLFGGGGGYYAHGRYGGAGLGGVLGLVLIVLVLMWLFGGFMRPMY